MLTKELVELFFEGSRGRFARGELVKSDLKYLGFHFVLLGCSGGSVGQLSRRRSNLTITHPLVHYNGNNEPPQSRFILQRNMANTGVISKRVGAQGGKSWGPSNKLALHTSSGIGIDFFQTDNRSFWTLLVCRTGSAAMNTRICNAAIARGQTWNMYRGFEDRRTGDLLFVPESEQALFAHVRLPYLEPKERE